MEHTILVEHHEMIRYDKLMPLSVKICCREYDFSWLESINKIKKYIAFINSNDELNITTTFNEKKNFCFVTVKAGDDSIVIKINIDGNYNWNLEYATDLIECLLV